VTGHGLKDPAWALKDAGGVEIVPTRVSLDAFSAANALGLGG
jgi:threonine synthase